MKRKIGLAGAVLLGFMVLLPFFAAVFHEHHLSGSGNECPLCDYVNISFAAVLPAVFILSLGSLFPFDVLFRKNLYYFVRYFSLFNKAPPVSL